MRKTIPLLFAVTLAGCQTMEIKESMFIRPDALTKRKPDERMVATNVTDLELQRPDGATLRGVLFTRPDAARTLVYYGGNMFHLDKHAKEVAGAFKSCKVNVAIFDYRGYGRSTGAPTVANMTDDAIAIYDMLDGRSPGNVGVHGQSLGSFVAAGVAQKRAVRSVVLETTATNALDTVNRSIPWYYKPFVRVKVEPALAMVDNLQAIARIQSPILFLSGAKDKTTPPELAQKVFNGVPGKHKQFVVLPNADHNNVLTDPSTPPVLCPFIEA